MNHKTMQPSIILMLVAIALWIKGFSSNQMIMVFAGVGIFILAMIRALLIYKFAPKEGEDVVSDDFAVQYLKKDPIRYVEMLYLYQAGNAKMLYEEADGLLFYDYTTDAYMGTAINDAAAQDIVRLLPPDYRIFVGMDEVFDKYMHKEMRISECVRAYNYVYEQNLEIKIDVIGVEIRPIELDQLETIKEHYEITYLFKESYLKERIEAGMLGAYVDGELAGFVGVHDNGAIGMLEVFKEYGGRNIGTLLQATQMNILLKQETNPPIYTQVNEDNPVSSHLQEKLKMTKAEKPCIWYFN